MFVVVVVVVAPIFRESSSRCFFRSLLQFCAVTRQRQGRAVLVALVTYVHGLLFDFSNQLLAAHARFLSGAGLQGELAPTPGHSGCDD